MELTSGMVWLLKMLLLLGTVSQSLSERCPPLEFVHPCRCYGFGSYIRVGCTRISEETIMRQALTSFQGMALHSLTLSSFNLPYFPMNLFGNITIRELYLDDGHMDRIKPSGETRSPFAGLEESLDLVEIRNSGPMEKWDWSDFSNLNALTAFYVIHGSLNEVPSSFSQLPKTITHVRFDAMENLTRVEENSFRDFKNLEQLHITNSGLTTLTRNSLPMPAHHVGVLTFSANRLTTLPEDLFVGMPQLKIVDVSRNGIQRFSEATFKPILNEALIDISGNPIVCDCNVAWILKEDVSKSFIREDFTFCAQPLGLQNKTLFDLTHSDLQCP